MDSCCEAIPDPWGQGPAVTTGRVVHHLVLTAKSRRCASYGGHEKEKCGLILLWGCTIGLAQRKGARHVGSIH